MEESLASLSYGGFHIRPIAAFGETMAGRHRLRLGTVWAWLYSGFCLSDLSRGLESASESVPESMLSGGVGLPIRALDRDRKLTLRFRRRAGAFSIYSICASASLCCHTLALELSELCVDAVETDSCSLDRIVILLLIRARLDTFGGGRSVDLANETGDTLRLGFRGGGDAVEETDSRLK